MKHSKIEGEFMTKPDIAPQLHIVTLIILILFFISDISAHDAGALNDPAVDRTNDAIAASMLQVQVSLTEIFQASQSSSIWPVPEIDRMQKDILHLKEEADLTLEYLLANGINIQSSEALIANPRAGRSVSASHAIATATSLLKHAATLEKQEDFRKEIYTGGLAAYMYNLLGAHRDKMQLYGELMKTTR